MKLSFLKIALCFLLIILSRTSIACKMTPIGSSSNAMIAVLNYVANNAAEKDQTITSIKQSSTPWIFSVETTKEGSKPSVVQYQTIITPSCDIKVQRYVKGAAS